MKLLVVLSIRELHDEVAKILEQSGVDVFSVSKIVGYKKREQRIGWFGSSNGQANSVAFFSFTNAESAEKALDNITNCIYCKENNFPIRGFVLNVEDFSFVQR